MKNRDERPQEEKRTNQLEPGFQEKKPYQKPAFRHEQVFEIRALICGKVGSSSSQCRSLGKYS
jgi:hypothetical protein